LAKDQTQRTDKEVELYRSLLETPDTFEEGFGWTTVAGIFFCGLVMLPGSIYLGLMSGGNLGMAASWVTVILFNEIARRSLKSLKKQNLVILLHAAQVVMAANVLFPGGPFAQLVFRAYLATSDPIRDAGMRGVEHIPTWFVPAPDSPAITERNLLHVDWAIPILLLVFTVFIGLLRRYTLGYFFFRLTSDIESLPFPMAPIQAQGAMAMAEHDNEQNKQDAGKAFFDKNKQGNASGGGSLRWRLFSFGAVLGLVFGFIQVGIPALTGVFLEQRVFLLPQPFVDTTTLTEGVLPATATGVAIDMGILLLGMVIPFWAVMGTAFAIVLTLVLNPILYQFGMIPNWQPGMNTINTTFAAEVDFWMSFMIGAALALLVISIYQSVRDVRRKMKAIRQANQDGGNESQEDAWSTPRGRGDYPLWIALALYVVSALATIGVTYLLLSRSPLMTPGVMLNVMIFLFIFTFVYNPLLSYLNARLLGVAGQTVDIPHMKEFAFVLSGARGLDIWMAPIPVENYGHQAQAFRVTELTGTRFWSLIKTDLVAITVLLVLSFAFWAFIWSGSDIPSAGFPYAQTFWELQAKRTTLVWSSTHVTTGEQTLDFWQTELGQAIKPDIIGYGFGSVFVLFLGMSAFGLPIMFIYGIIKGLGVFPHMLVFEVVGALLARFYFYKKFGKQNFLRNIPTVVAGYFTGVGLIGMATVALELIQKAISSAPF